MRREEEEEVRKNEGMKGLEMGAQVVARKGGTFCTALGTSILERESDTYDIPSPCLSHLFPAHLNPSPHRHQGRDGMGFAIAVTLSLKEDI